MDPKNLETNAQRSWCPGCGNFEIKEAVKSVFRNLVSENYVKKENIVVVTGSNSGASPGACKIADHLNVNSVISPHATAVSIGMGMKIANPKLEVLIILGDDDAFNEGLMHTIYAAKKNVDVTLIVANNGIYNSQVINPLELILASGATFIARSSTSRLHHLKKMIKRAIEHKGFAIVDVLEPCVAAPETHYYEKPEVRDLQNENYDIFCRNQAISKIREWNYQKDTSAKIPIGIIYSDKRASLQVSATGKVDQNKRANAIISLLENEE